MFRESGHCYFKYALARIRLKCQISVYDQCHYIHFLQMEQELDRLRRQLDQSEGGRDTLLQQVKYSWFQISFEF